VKQIARIGMRAGFGQRAAALAATAALALLPAGSSAQAAVITWTLQNVTFDDGGTASGFFDYDTTSGRAENFDITTTGGSELLSFHYDSSSSQFFAAQVYAPNDLLWIESNSLRYLDLGFDGALDAPGTVALTNHGGALGWSYECDNCTDVRYVTDGSVTGRAAAPEPVGWALMLIGFLGAGAALRGARRREAAPTIG
jgi:hypothetical protein